MTFADKPVTCALLVTAIAIGPNLARAAPRSDTAASQTHGEHNAEPDPAVNEERLDRFIEAAVAVADLRQAYAEGRIEAHARQPDALTDEIASRVAETVEAHGLDLAEYRAIGERLEWDAQAIHRVPSSPTMDRS